MRKKLLSTILVLATATGLQAQTRVSTTADLEQALSTATSGTQIYVNAGIYQPTGTLVVPAGVKLYGGFAGTESPADRDLSSNVTILDGQNNFGIVRLGTGAILDGFTIRNGHAQAPNRNGGGVYADGNNTIENCIITNNRAQLNGGGLYAGGLVTITNSSIQNNTAEHGDNTFGACLVITTTCSGSGVGASPAPVELPDDELTAINCATTVNFGAFGTVTWGGNDNIETQTWTVGSQVWSDAVQLSNCDKDFSGTYSTDDYDCYRAINGFNGHLFSWCFVKRYEALLCPGTWRVPTTKDFATLHQSLGYTLPNVGVSSPEIANTYMGTIGSGDAAENHGGAWGGSRFTGLDGAANNLSGYWSSTESSSSRAFFLLYVMGSAHPQVVNAKHTRLALRCVRDN